MIDVRVIKKNWNFLLGATLVLFVCIVAIFAPFLAPYDPILDADIMVAEEPPSAKYLLVQICMGATCFPALSMDQEYH